MSLQSIINGLNTTFNNNVKNLVNYYNSKISSIMTSILINKINKNNLIKQIQNYFNTTYNNLKNKLNSDIKKAKEQAQQAQQAQAQQAQAQQAQAQQAQAQQQAQVEVIKPVNKTALLIGCNYVGTNYQLSGCINEV
jgi:hypothetical protein